MKIVAKDNFDTEIVADFLAAENVPEIYAKTIVDALNNKFSGDSAPRFFVIKHDDYRLWRGMEDLV